MSPKDHKNSTIMSFEKLSGEQVFKNHNCNPFQYSSSSSLLCFVFSVPFRPSNVLSGYFNVSLNLVEIPSHCLNFDNCYDTAPLSDTGFYIQWCGSQTKMLGSILGFWETAYLPLP